MKAKTVVNFLLVFLGATVANYLSCCSAEQVSRHGNRNDNDDHYIFSVVAG